MGAIQVALVTILLSLEATTVVLGDDKTPIPASKSELGSWFKQNVKQLNKRKSTLDPALYAAEKGVKVIKVRKDGKGDFKKITDAVNSVPNGNTRRVVISIGPGQYKEKITIDRSKKFVTLYGDPESRPTLVYDGTAAKYGTVDSATLITLADYFTAANLIIKNSAPRPDGKKKGAQAVALRVSGDKSAFYNCRIIGYQDTLCDDRGYHFFKDCYIEGTVDFIFGSGTSLYLNTELHVIGEDGIAVITAQARESNTEKTGYSFVHCKVTGNGRHAYLGRAWQTRPRVVYAYTTLSNAINPEGWSDNAHPERHNTVFYGEFKNLGLGSNKVGRVKYSKELTYNQVKPYISLGYIKGSSWLLPPPKA
ncbi:Pectinesterase, Tyr active site [Trema orientale]|uniref:Pectinesterase n=1 Tax=Trema orientale TaxID=63057 RepID=A0A2P5F3U2_TREOI|nr:Pectinesterase, Tyr active site [Trema orientale]